MAFAGAHRITVDPFGSDLLTSPALDRFIDPDHHRAYGQKRIEQGTQQDQTEFQIGPDGTVQNTMVILPVLAG